MTSKPRNNREPKLRLGSFLVQPLLMWDDGESLTPALNQDGGHLVSPLTVTPSGLRELADNWPEQFARIQAQLQPTPAKPARSAHDRSKGSRSV